MSFQCTVAEGEETACTRSATVSYRSHVIAYKSAAIFHDSNLHIVMDCRDRWLQFKECLLRAGPTYQLRDRQSLEQTTWRLEVAKPN